MRFQETSEGSKDLNRRVRMRAQTPVLDWTVRYADSKLNVVGLQNPETHQDTNADLKFEFHLDIPQEGNG
jgi:hypothetical protein